MSERRSGIDNLEKNQSKYFTEEQITFFKENFPDLEISKIESHWKSLYSFNENSIDLTPDDFCQVISEYIDKETRIIRGKVRNALEYRYLDIGYDGYIKIKKDRYKRSIVLKLHEDKTDEGRRRLGNRMYEAERKYIKNAKKKSS